MSSQVLYVDHHSHPVPLALCYHVTGTDLLACGVSHRIPPCTTNTELESGYCPQCLAFWDASTVASHKGICVPTTHSSVSHGGNLHSTEDRTNEDTYFSVGGGCKSCPICNCILVMTVLPDYSQSSKPMICVWSCGYCHWDSTECNISVPLFTDEQGGVDATIQSLQSLLGMHMVKDRKTKSAIVQALHTGYRQFYVDEWKSKRQRELLAMHGLVLNSSTTVEDGAPRGRKSISDLLSRPTWSLEALEQALEKKKQGLNAEGDALQSTTLLDNLWAFHGPSSSLPIAPFITAQNPVSNSSSASSYLPIPVPLLPRTIRRCRAELAAGRPGILVKPKSNPMDGDTSLKYGHGQWWKKDSSAIHTIPKVKILRYGTEDSSNDGQFYAFLLLITNPTLETIHLTLDRDIRVITQYEMDDEKMKHVLLDPFSLQSVDARYEPPLQSIHDGVTLTLEPAEDLFLDLGMTSYISSDVLHWDAKVALSKNRTPCFRIASQKKDRAWVEFILDRGDWIYKHTEMKYIATPLCLKMMHPRNTSMIPSGIIDAMDDSQREPETAWESMTAFTILLLSQLISTSKE